LLFCDGKVMSVKTKLGLLLLLCGMVTIASASEVAVLRNGFTIRHELRMLIGPNTRLFPNAADQSSYVDIPTAEIERIEPDLTPASGSVETTQTPVVPPAPTARVTPTPKVDIHQAVAEASDRYRLDPDLLDSVIRAESGFNPHAVSPKGARGLMQLMPDTASKLGVPNAFDPAANVDGGTRYLRELLERYNFDLIKALAAYNAGPHRVEQYKGVPPYRETRHYVASIVRDFNRKKLAQEKAERAVKLAQKKPATQTAAATKRTTQPTGN
jgi:soluble lytic murein transglycosylase-like protein